MNLNDIKIQKVNLGDKNYPKILAKIKNPPQTLYYRGDLKEELFKKSLAIVGSRRMTRYGKIVIEKFLPSLIEAKITIISGFMYGIDSEAHKKCLEYGGKTVAVLGGGLNIIYPPENEKVYFQIIKNGGAVISEYPPDFKPQLWTFPQRNRIIAGLSSLGVLVVEAGEKSGSLITAKFARQQGKKVYSIPGPITSSSSFGTNWLIKNHFAKMVTAPEEILGEKPENISLFSFEDLSEIEIKIIEALKKEPFTADEIAQILKKEIKEINQNLSLLAIKGIIFENQGKYYLKV